MGNESSQLDFNKSPKETTMKRLILITMIAVLAVSSAFAKITIGVTSNQYYPGVDGSVVPSLENAWNDLITLNNVYFGGFVEMNGKNNAFGVSFNFATNEGSSSELWAYDLNTYWAYHFFGTRAFLDLFIQGGVGIISYDYMDKTAYELADNYAPQLSAFYADFGPGLGINLGNLGIFTKVMFNFRLPWQLSDSYGTPIPLWPLMPAKWVFGAKVTL